VISEKTKIPPFLSTKTEIGQIRKTENPNTPPPPHPPPSLFVGLAEN